MRQRTTFLQSTADVLDPSRLKISADEISGPKLHAARHDKLTFTVDELPQELYRILKASREFRVRWSSFSPYQTSVPVSSRLPPGLHVFYAPKQTQADWLLSDGKQYALKPARDILCSGLKKAFGSIVCEEFSVCVIQFNSIHVDLLSYKSPGKCHLGRS